MENIKITINDKKWFSNYDLFQEITTYVNARKK